MKEDITDEEFLLLGFIIRCTDTRRTKTDRSVTYISSFRSYLLLPIPSHTPCVCALAPAPLCEWDDVILFFPGVNRHGDMNIH